MSTRFIIIQSVYCHEHFAAHIQASKLMNSSDFCDSNVFPLVKGSQNKLNISIPTAKDFNSTLLPYTTAWTSTTLHAAADLSHSLSRPFKAPFLSYSPSLNSLLECTAANIHFINIYSYHIFESPSVLADKTVCPVPALLLCVLNMSCAYMLKGRSWNSAAFTWNSCPLSSVAFYPFQCLILFLMVISIVCILANSCHSSRPKHTGWWVIPVM